MRVFLDLRDALLGGRSIVGYGPARERANPRGEQENGATAFHRANKHESETCYKRGMAEERARVSWDQYFMNIAREVSTRSTCDRKHVGAVIVRDKMILATGYNGSIRGLPHCDDVGHDMEEGHCVRTVHAEANAIVQAASNGVRIIGSGIYVTASPCWSCFRLIANAGIGRIVFGEFYRDQRIFETSQRLGIELIDYSKRDK